MQPSSCPPWQPEPTGPSRRIPRRAPGSYTTARDTISRTRDAPDEPGCDDAGGTEQVLELPRFRGYRTAGERHPRAPAVLELPHFRGYRTLRWPECSVSPRAGSLRGEPASRSGVGERIRYSAPPDMDCHRHPLRFRPQGAGPLRRPLLFRGQSRCAPSSWPGHQAMLRRWPARVIILRCRACNVNCDGSMSDRDREGMSPSAIIPHPVNAVRAIQIPSHVCLMSSSASSSAGVPSHRMRPLPST